MRLLDWPARLAGFIEARRDQPFSWGDNDCVSFCAAAIEAMTEENPLRFSYSSEREARRILRSHGGLEAMVDDVYPRRNVLDLQRGDLGLVRNGDMQTLCVIWPPHAIGPGLTGIVLAPVEECVCGWMV